MYKSCWWNRKEWKRDKRRVAALAFIEDERQSVEEMVQRPRLPVDPFRQEDIDLLNKVIHQLDEIEKSAKSPEADYERLGDLMGDAETQGQYRAYFCPAIDVQHEGELVFSIVTTEWGLPKSVTKYLEKVKDDLKKPAAAEARAALHILLSERDEWDDYTDDYEDTMWSYTWKLFLLSIALPIGSGFCFRYAFHPHSHWLLVLGMLAAGVAGSCVSIMGRMPEFDVRLSNELIAYRRRILSRIGLGIAASIIGSALLGWGFIPLSIQQHTFTDAIRACTTSSCGGVDLLLLVCIPMVLGFSERALTTIEQRLFGEWTKPRKAT
jgi:hypothetical protein